MKHGAAAISEICQYEIMNPGKTTGALMKILAKLDGVSPWSETSVFQQATGVQKSFRVYLCYALINWLISIIEKSRDTGEQTISINPFLVFLQEAIPCVLDKETVDYTMATCEVTKLENSLIAGGDEDAMVEMIKKLERVKLMQRSFVEKRVHAPSPTVVYSRALELASLLGEGMEKDDFVKAVNDAWKNATT
uniref:Uncharacterized protein n=1 Tax=Bracon brevicornis TaxID=1563983 RepID=A0A6V7LP74_9HYME